MKITPTPVAGTFQPWARLARRTLGLGLVVLGLGTAHAQTFAISTYGGAAGAPLNTNTSTGPATLARFNNPAGIATDGTNLYVADAANNLIRQIVISSGVTTTLAGSGTAGSTNNTGVLASFNAPQGVAVDGSGNLYVADTGNHLIRKIVISTGAVTTVAGAAGTFTPYADNSTGTSATFNSPVGLVVVGANLYVADTGNSSIRQIVLTSPYAVSTFAGSTLGATSGITNGTGTAAFFNHPAAITSDGTNLYVADSNNNSIRQIVIASQAVTTLAGTNGSASGSTDATGAAARFNGPGGIVAKGANLYVADTLNNTIRQVVIASGAVTTLAGTAGSSNTTNGVGAAARFSGPTGIAADASSNLYISDTNNQTIRFGGPAIAASVGSYGTNASTTVGGNASFGVTGVTGNPTPTYQWQVSTNGGTSFTNLTNVAPYSGVTTATLTITGATLAMNNYQYQCVVTNGVGTAPTPSPKTLTVQQAPTITSANSTTFSVGTPGQTFTVTATGSGTMAYTVISGSFPSWASLASSTGVISGTPPNTTGSPFVFTIQASNTIGTPATQSFTLTVTPPTAPQITGSPSNVTVNPSTATASFSVTGVTGSPTPTYQWQVSTNSGSTWTNLSNGAISGGGGTVSGATTASLSIASVTAVLNNDQFRVAAINSVSTVYSSAATLTAPVPVITSSPTSFQLAAGQSIQSLSGSTVTASNSPTSFAVSSGFPSWASFNTSSGAITGTPSASNAGTSNFTVTASNSLGTSAAVAFSITVTAGPSITSGPSGASVSAGYTAQFTVNVNSSVPSSLTYQWLRQPASGGGFSYLSDSSGVYSGSVSGAGTTSSTLSVNGAYTNAAMNGDQFQVIVNDSTGYTTSAVATLTILQPPAITSLNTANFVENVAGSLFTVQATGVPTPTITLTGGSLPTGLTLSGGVISGTAATGTSAYSPYNLQFTASNGVGSSYTQNFTLTVSPTALIPTFTTQPTNLTVALGQTATFTVVATGSPAPTYQWQRQPNGTAGFSNLTNDGINFSGVTTATLTITNPTSGMSGDQFLCVASNSTGYTNSTPVTMTVVIGTTITTFAGQTGAVGSWLDATGTAARFNGPAAIAIDTLGNFYVADSSNHVIRKITSAGVVTTLAGAAGISGNIDGTGTAARFNAPSGVAVDSAGNVYVADTYNHTIRVIAPGGTVTTLAGLAGNVGGVDGAGSTARFAYPTGVAVDNSSSVYVADSFNHSIRKIVNGTVSTLAGTLGVRGNVNGSGSSARFAYPNDVAVDSSGNVYVADSYNEMIRVINPGGLVSTLAGSAGTIGNTDGTGTAALFNQPSGIVVDSAGNVYVADTGNNTIRKVTSAGVVTTLAGLAGSSGVSDGTGSTARFNTPFGITVDTSGNLYIADTRNNSIRRSGSVSAPSVQTQPQNQTAGIGQNATFSVTATGSPTPGIFQWQRQAAGTSGFVNLANDGVNYSGVTTSTLTVSGVTAAMNGDQFQVIVSNLISPNATSNIATLITTPPPVFTSAASATFNVGQTNTFTVAATSSSAVSYSSTALPSWLSLNASTGVLSGTPPDASASPLAITFTASNGGTTTQSFTLTIVVPIVVPTITAQPASITANPGDNVSFGVTVIGTAPFTYQWSKNGIPITGATNATFSLATVGTTSAGSYQVVVKNAISSTTSNAATLTINAAPVITTEPRAQTAILGSAVTFSVGVSASPAATYQWRLNGALIAGANGSSYSIASVQLANAGNYDVIVTNPLGIVSSSIAQLSVVTAASAPAVTAQPTSRTVLLGSSTTFTVSAAGAPAPTYQWRKNGSPIAGAVGPSLTFGLVQLTDAGNYDVVVSNSAGSVTSSVGSLIVIRRSYAGLYFGTFGGSIGGFALYVRGDNTGVLLGYLPGSGTAIKNLNFTINDSGQFSFTQTAAGSITASSVTAQSIGGDGVRAAATGDMAFAGTIASDGTLSGTVTGIAGASLSATQSNAAGATQAYSGYYQAAAANTSSSELSIVGPAGLAFVLTQTSAGADGGLGAVDASGHVTVVTSKQVISATVNNTTSTITGTAVSGATSTTYSGASDTVVATERLSNISTRAAVGTGANVAIAGFVISGTESKPVLIRAIGPTLASAFGLTTAVTAPKLDLYNGANAIIASNTGWANASNTSAIVAATTQAGAFQLGATSADSVIFTTLAPGNYTAIVSSANGGQGVALVEVYDLSAPEAGQKLFNISTRANAGTGVNTLIAGFVVNGVAPKRVLIRAVGPGLTQLGLTGVISQPQLLIVNPNTNQLIAQNTGWGTSPDASAIATAAAQAGAFPLVAGSGDSALLISLAPGSYSAQVVGVGGTTGIAIVEVYEVP